MNATLEMHLALLKTTATDCSVSDIARPTSIALKDRKIVGG